MRGLILLLAITLPDNSFAELGKDNLQPALNFAQNVTTVAASILDLKDDNKDTQFLLRKDAYCQMASDVVNLNLVTKTIFRSGSRKANETQKVRMTQSILNILSDIFTNKLSEFLSLPFDWDKSTIRYRAVRNTTGDRVHGYELKVNVLDKNEANKVIAKVEFKMVQRPDNVDKLSLLDLKVKGLSLAKFIGSYDNDIRIGMKTLDEVLDVFENKYSACSTNE